MSEYILAGSLHGAVVWGAYAVIEQALCIALPLSRGCDITPAANYADVLATVMGAWLAVGLVLGAACGLALWLRDRRRAVARALPFAARPRGAAAATLAVASGASWSLIRPFGKVEALMVAVSVVVLAGLALCEARPARGESVGFLGNPWVAGLVLFGAGWVGREALAASTGLVPFAGAAGVVAATLGVTAVGSRAWRRRGWPADTFLPARGASVVAVAAAVLLGLYPRLARWTPRPVQPPRPSAASGRPNVVLVTLDTVRADHLSPYGYARDTTPFLGTLAKRATLYGNAVAASNITLTTHASVFTGLYGSWHGAHFAPPDLPLGRPLGRRPATLAGILSANGYRTVSVVANFGYLGPGFGLTRGFQASYTLSPPAEHSRFLLRDHLWPLVDALFSSDELAVGFCRAEEVNRAVFSVLDQARAGTSPLFLFVNYMDCHMPYTPPPPFDTLFPGRVRSLRTDSYRTMQDAVMHGRRAMSPREHDHLVSQYDGALRYLDSQLAVLVSRLEELGLYQNTLIVITSDHGEAIGDHGLVEHGFSLYRDQIRIPLIVKYPGQATAEASGTTVSQVDIMPTVLDVVGLPIPAAVQGESLRRSADAPRRAVMSESFPSSYFPPRFLHLDRAVVSGSMELIARGDGGQELYDLANDPGELANLYRPDDRAAAALSGFLDGWLRAPPPDVDGAPIDADALRRLRSLGYVQ